jgi:hypothetical protein
MDANAGVQSSGNGSASAPAASSSTLSTGKGKGKEVTPSPEVGSSTPRIDKGKAKEINTVLDPSTEEIFSPGVAAAAQRGLAGGLGNAGPLLGNNVLGAGAGGNDLLSGFLGLGGGGMGGGGGGIGMNGVPGSARHPGGGRSNGVDGWGGGMGDMGGFRSFGDSINNITESVLGNLHKLGTGEQGQGGGGDGDGGNATGNGGKTDNRNGDTGARGAASSGTHNGSWSGRGIQSRLSDEGT